MDVKGTNPALPVNTEKAKALAAALAQIEKQFGKGTIMRLGEGEAIEDIQVVSTGSLGLDIALGVGGLPRYECPAVAPQCARPDWPPPDIRAPAFHPWRCPAPHWPRWCR